MKRILQTILLILFAVTVCSEQGALAKLVLRHSISSISNGQGSISSIIKGTVDLIAPRTIRGSLRSIYLGNSNLLKTRKRIKVEGNFIGNRVTLEGLGDVGEGYEFFFRVPGSLYAANNRHFIKRPRASITASYDSLDFGKIEDDLKIKVLKGRRSKTSQKITGTFSKKTSRGTAKGRFNLKLHRNAFLNN